MRPHSITGVYFIKVTFLHPMKEYPIDDWGVLYIVDNCSETVDLIRVKSNAVSVVFNLLLGILSVTFLFTVFPY